MATLLAWTTIEIGDLQIFAPTLPCLVVNTWYIDDDQPDSTVTYFWQDEATGSSITSLCSRSLSASMPRLHGRRSMLRSVVSSEFMSSTDQRRGSAAIPRQEPVRPRWGPHALRRALGRR